VIDALIALEHDGRRSLRDNGYNGGAKDEVKYYGMKVVRGDRVDLSSIL
jgi:hypothetical protein